MGVRIGPRMIPFPKIIGRSYGFRTLPLTLKPGGLRDYSSAKPLPLRGTQPDEISAKASRININDSRTGSPGRSFLGRTEDALNSGPVPSYIPRNAPASNAGNIGRSMFWPYDGNAIYVPHQIVPRRPISGVQFVRSIDTGVTIPAIPIGAPVR